MNNFEEKINYKFSDPVLLEIALTHSSYANEHFVKSNERLEFLGDSVLSIVISNYLFARLKDVDEGELSKFRAILVCEDSLAIVAKKISLSSYIKLGNGEALSGGRERPSIVSDAFEALIAAIYLDGGIETASKWILDIMNDIIEETLEGKKYSDYKTMLQELLQKAGRVNVTYRTVKAYGKDHNRQFVVEAVSGDTVLASGTGRSKKDAEQHAAQRALEIMNYEEA